MSRPLGGLDYEASAICVAISGNSSKLSKECLKQIREKKFIVKK